MTLSWDAVTTDCRGGSETVIGYVAMLMLVNLLGWIPVEDHLNPVYEWGGWTEAGRTAETEIAVDVPAPGPGGVAFIRIDSEDAAGHRSDEVCD